MTYKGFQNSIEKLVELGLFVEVTGSQRNRLYLTKDIAKASPEPHEPTVSHIARGGSVLAAGAALFLIPGWGLSVACLCIWLACIALQATKEHFRFNLRWMFKLVLVVAVVCWLITLYNKMEEMIDKDHREKYGDDPRWRIKP